MKSSAAVARDASVDGAGHVSSDEPQQALPTVCYVVPSYDVADASHLAHLPRFLEELGRHCNLHVIVERGAQAPVVRTARSVRRQTRARRAPRMLELAMMALELRAAGCDRFFVRISPGAAFVLNVLALFVPIRVYYWMSGQPRNLWPSWRTPRRRLSFVFGDRIARLNVRLAHRLVTGPETMVDYCAREFGLGRERIALLYNDVPAMSAASSREVARRELGFDQHRPLVLFVGRVSPLKGGHNILPLADALRTQAPDAVLVVVGDTTALPHVPLAARAKGLENVRFVGAVPNAALAPYYRAADVFVLPSESEGFPRVLLEAMLHGVPAVAFDVGGVRDIVDPSQLDLVVRRGDIGGMARRVACLLADPQRRDEEARIGAARVGRYSTESVAKMFVAAVGDR